MKEFAVHSTRIVTPEKVVSGYLLISEGKIADICDHLPSSYSFEVIEAGNQCVMPGLIDPHVHINEPGRTFWEGFNTATTAAAASGITMLVDMPLNSTPVTTTLENFQVKLHAAENTLHVNVGFWGGVVPGNENHLEELLRGGVLGLKAFLTHSGIDDFPNAGRNELRNALRLLKKYDRPLLVHCELSEDHEGIAQLKKQTRSYKAYLNSRPKSWENKAIEMMIELCRETGAKVHIVHLSSAEALPMIESARREGLPLSVETTQHYLVFSAEEIPDGDTTYKCAPPIREKANNDQLWNALKSGLIDFVATDHSPAPPDIKEISSGDFSKAWGGIAGLQFALPSFWTAAKARGFTVSDVARLMSSSPADFLTISGKGRLAKGCDADFFIWEPESEISFEGEDIEHRHKVSPYAGKKYFGKVISTYLNGIKVYENRMLKTPVQGRIILSK